MRKIYTGIGAFICAVAALVAFYFTIWLLWEGLTSGETWVLLLGFATIFCPALMYAVWASEKS
jgi:hypothetical protein